ncbi:MAG: peptidylprolyl isomerase [Flavipsychrobacter sp.]|jgi:peptidyl-prolyl cis-trans isomerase B (cyclophilin B)|nr:peptidylprolyl isomerase [Flavipsychrobacter sp.]
MKKIFLAVVSLCLATTLFAQKRNEDKIVIETEYGKIVLALYENTPKHRDNMFKLVKEKFYDSTLFHRVIPNFVIQGGDPDSKRATPGQALGEGDLGYKVPAEINSVNYHQRGALGMARDNNPEKASSACQFYIVVGKKYSDEELNNISKKTGRNFTPVQRNMYKNKGGTPHLDGNYTVFGVVEEGMEIVDRIAAETRNTMDRPDKDIKMDKVRIKKKKKFLLF